MTSLSPDEPIYIDLGRCPTAPTLFAARGLQHYMGSSSKIVFCSKTPSVPPGLDLKLCLHIGPYPETKDPFPLYADIPCTLLEESRFSFFPYSISNKYTQTGRYLEHSDKQGKLSIDIHLLDLYKDSLLPYMREGIDLIANPVQDGKRSSYKWGDKIVIFNLSRPPEDLLSMAIALRSFADLVIVANLKEKVVAVKGERFFEKRFRKEIRGEAKDTDLLFPRDLYHIDTLKTAALKAVGESR